MENPTLLKKILKKHEDAVDAHSLEEKSLQFAQACLKEMKLINVTLFLLFFGFFLYVIFIDLSNLAPL